MARDCSDCAKFAELLSDWQSKTFAAEEKVRELESVVQMCFDDICKPSGKISKATARKLMQYADTAA